MADDIDDTDLEMARARARARQRKANQVTSVPITTEESSAAKSILPTGSGETLGSTSISGTALRGFGQGASFGFSDELAGGVKGAVAGLARSGAHAAHTGPGRAAIRAYLGKPNLSDAETDLLIEQAMDQTSQQVLGMPGLPVDPDQALEAGYRSGRDESRLENVQARQANPWTFAGAQLAGAIAAPGPKFAKAGTPGRLASIAKTGSAMGGANALGQSESDLTRMENDPQAIMDTVGETAFGAGMGGIAAPIAAIGADKAGRYLTRAQADNALKALGLRAGISDQLQKRGYETADNARELGKAALDMELIRPFRTASDVAERAGFAKQVQGARIEGALADADAAGLARQNAANTQFVSSLGKGPAPVDPPPIFDSQRAAWRSVEEVMGPDGLSPTAIREGGRAKRLVEDVIALPKVQESTFANANKLKSDMYSGINYATDPALKTTLERRAASGLRKSIEEQMGETAGPDAVDELRAANRAYGFLADIEPLAQEESTRQLARQVPWSKSIQQALIAGGGGAAMGGMAGGGATGATGGAVGFLAPLVGNAMQSRIPSTLAVGQRALAPRIGPLMMGAQRGAIQPPLRPSVDEEEETAIKAFLSGG